MRATIASLLTAGAVVTGARGDVPQVVTDIAPVHGLVTQVMAGVGAPELVVPPGASPHGYAMRPSEARALSRADLVIWIGPDLSPWLEDRIAALAPDAGEMRLIEADGTVTLTFRDMEDFGRRAAPAAAGDAHAEHDHAHREKAHAHDDHDHAHDDHAHGETAEHAHAHDGHGHGDHALSSAEHVHGEHDHAHAPGAIDPHVWLDPENARAWLPQIAERLAELDPEHADVYRNNAARGAEEIAARQTQLAGELAPVADTPLLVYHDAYQYFEARFGLEVIGAVTLADASEASAGHLAAVRTAVAETGAGCVLADPSARDSLVAAVAGTDVRIVEADPSGLEIRAGESFYLALLDHLAEAVKRCLVDPLR